MARIRTEEEKEAARQAAKQAKKDQWLREQEEKRPTHEKYMKDAIPWSASFFANKKNVGT